MHFPQGPLENVYFLCKSFYLRFMKKFFSMKRKCLKGIANAKVFLPCDPLKTYPCLAYTLCYVKLRYIHVRHMPVLCQIKTYPCQAYTPCSVKLRHPCQAYTLCGIKLRHIHQAYTLCCIKLRHIYVRQIPYVASN